MYESIDIEFSFGIVHILFVWNSPFFLNVKHFKGTAREVLQ